ncbi:hypothetical protein C5167_048100 [Papaver somniferum]|uniref:Uncharacterized protein n=1 Tax=Papaver somniferum TaxID=3469 RepID=A0A4Y7KID3_PAPSO|nr:hypothetical protein C5167_048100 [Papaver somniferum]
MEICRIYDGIFKEHLDGMYVAGKLECSWCYFLVDWNVAAPAHTCELTTKLEPPFVI